MTPKKIKHKHYPECGTDFTWADPHCKKCTWLNCRCGTTWDHTDGHHTKGVSA